MNGKARSVRPARRTDFQVGILCVLKEEFNAVVAALDEGWSGERYKKAPGDWNAYQTGKMSGHNVVLAFIPSMGKVKASDCAAGMRSSFPSITLCLLVGVCGASPVHPGDRANIMLGDVVISTGIVQTDFGRQFSDGIHPKDTTLDRLGPPNMTIQGHLKMLSENKMLSSLRHDTASFVREILAQPAFESAHSPGRANDNLYLSDYRHKHRPPFDCAVCEQGEKGEDKICSDAQKAPCSEIGCNQDYLVRRERLEPGSAEPQPLIHFGIVGSSDQVMKSASHRDRLSQRYQIAAFEMEGAGVWQQFPTIIIKSACDYADSHKSKAWQMYAGVVAAACSKAFLKTWSQPDHPQSDDGDAMEGVVHNRMEECLKALDVTDPKLDMEMIRSRKDEMLRDTCSWIWGNPGFDEWWKGQGSHFSWLHGDAGKGKTMMMIDLATSIQQRLDSDSGMIAYFFCQGAISSANKATSILRGLIYCLLKEDHTLQKHITKRLDASEAGLFEGSNPLHLLWQALSEIVADSQVPQIYLMVDALDECVEGTYELLSYMTRKDLKLPEKARWIISSRNEPRLKGPLSKCSGRQQIDLEENANRVVHAIERYVKRKVKDLASSWVKDQALEQYIRDYLIRNANGTFLWVALVCEELRKADAWEVKDILQRFPPGLTPVYDKMMETINSGQSARFCKSLLGALAIARKRLTLDEACFIANLPTDKFNGLESIADLATRCGSFVTVQGNNLGFVHQSALDYIFAEGSRSIFPGGLSQAHADISSRSLDLMAMKLQEDMCNLSFSGALVDEIEQQKIDAALSPNLQYACLFWVVHLKMACENAKTPMTSTDVNRIGRFLECESLNWLEALSLMKCISVATQAVEELVGIQEAICSDAVNVIVADLQRFLKTFRAGIEVAPLQVYTSGLTFAPAESHLFQTHSHLQSGLVSSQRISQWDQSSHVLEGHSDTVTEICFSPNGDKLASASSMESEVKIWDTKTGRLLNQLNDFRVVTALAYSPADNDALACGHSDGCVTIWQLPSREPKDSSVGDDDDAQHYEPIVSLAISKDGSLIASGSTDCKIVIWDMKTGASLRFLSGHNDMVNLLQFSPNVNAQLVSGSYDGFIQLWDVVEDILVTGLIKDSEQDLVTSMAISTRSHTIAAGFYSGLVEIHEISELIKDYNEGRVSSWNTVRRQPDSLVAAEGSAIHCVAISSRAEYLAAGGEDRIVRIWELDKEVETLFATLEGHQGAVRSVAMSRNGAQLVSGSDDGTIRIWDRGVPTAVLTGHYGSVKILAYSPKENLLASASADSTVRLWDSASAEPFNRRSLTGHTKSPTNSKLSGENLQDSSTQHQAPICYAKFSKDGTWLITGSEDKDLRIWNPKTGERVDSLRGHTENFDSVSFSSDESRLLFHSSDGTAKVWNLVQRSCTNLDVRGFKLIALAFIAGGEEVLAATSEFIAVWGLNGTPSGQFRGIVGLRAVTVSLDGNFFGLVGEGAPPKFINAKTRQVVPSPKEPMLSTKDKNLRRVVGWLKSTDASHRWGELEVSEDKRWITVDGERRLWLPSNIRPVCFARHRDVIAICGTSGEVAFISHPDDGRHESPSGMELD